MDDHDIEESLKRLHAPAPPANWQRVLNDMIGYVAMPIVFLSLFCVKVAWESAQGRFYGSFAMVIAVAAASLVPIACIIVGELHFSAGRYNRALLFHVCAVLSFLLVLSFAIYFFLSQPILVNFW